MMIKKLVKGAAIGVLAKTKNPKYLPLFEKESMQFLIR